MTCSYCSLKKGPFKTEAIYIDFQKQINSLVQRGILIKIGKADPKSLFLERKYSCHKCDQVWILKVPDQAFRGGWYEND